MANFNLKKTIKKKLKRSKLYFIYIYISLYYIDDGTS